MNTATLRALTLLRPWPTLIMRHGKDVENRPMQTHYRGPLIIHAGLRYDFDGVDDVRGILDAATFRDLLAADHDPGFVGVVDVVDCHRGRDRYTGGNAAACACGPWAYDDYWHWVLARPRPFSSLMPGPGAQGLFRPPPAVTDRALMLGLL